MKLSAKRPISSRAAASRAGLIRAAKRSEPTSRISRDSSLIGVVACAASTMEKQTTAIAAPPTTITIASLGARERALERVERFRHVNDRRARAFVMKRSSIKNGRPAIVSLRNATSWTAEIAGFGGIAIAPRFVVLASG